MIVLIGALVVTTVTAVAVGAMLAVRRRAPDGGRFADSDRASGVFGVLATGFSVLLGFIVFLSFTTYDESRQGAEAEAVVLAQQVETALLLPEPVASELTEELLCYGRSVVGEEWDRLEDQALDDVVNPWALELIDTTLTIEPETAVEQSAFDRWLDQTSAREEARNERVHAVAGIIPTPLWLVLLVVSAIIFAFLLFLADPTERAASQGMLMGSVVATITSLLLLLVFFNQPFHDDIGGLQPDSMERSLRITEAGLDGLGVPVDPPCDERGLPT